MRRMPIESIAGNGMLVDLMRYTSHFGFRKSAVLVSCATSVTNWSYFLSDQWFKFGAQQARQNAAVAVHSAGHGNR
jgi:hypothetical protein